MVNYQKKQFHQFFDIWDSVGAAAAETTTTLTYVLLLLLLLLLHLEQPWEDSDAMTSGVNCSTAVVEAAAAAATTTTEDGKARVCAKKERPCVAHTRACVKCLCRAQNTVCPT